MTNSVLLPASQARVWEALNDPEILKRCINGCESIERTGDDAYKVAMTVAVGPVKAKFKGALRLADIDPPNGYTLQFEGQGGVAGFGKGSAEVRLAPEDAGTRLSYAVNAQVGGKIAQLGSRLIDGASKKMADDFFEAFRVAISSDGSAADVAVAAKEERVAESGVVAPLVTTAVTTAVTAAAMTAASLAATPDSTSPLNPDATQLSTPRALNARVKGIESTDKATQSSDHPSHDDLTWLALAVAVAATWLMLRH